MRRLGGVFEASLGVLAASCSILRTSWDCLGAVLRAFWERLGATSDGLGVFGSYWGRTCALRKMVKILWFYSVWELPGFTKHVCEVVDAAQSTFECWRCTKKRPRPAPAAGEASKDPETVPKAGGRLPVPGQAKPTTPPPPTNGGAPGGVGEVFHLPIP